MQAYPEEYYKGVLITMHENGHYVAYFGGSLSSDTRSGIKAMIRARVKEKELAESKVEEQ